MAQYEITIQQMGPYEKPTYGVEIKPPFAAAAGLCRALELRRDGGEYPIKEAIVTLQDTEEMDTPGTALMIYPHDAEEPVPLTAIADWIDNDIDPTSGVEKTFHLREVGAPVQTYVSPYSDPIG